jgi:predicted HTH transcriptional regulator
MDTLAERIRKGESQHQDFKYRIDDQRKIARTLCAFANSEGGSLLIGVKDNGKVTGCNPQEEFHMIEGAAAVFCNPRVQFESKIWQDDFRLVLEVHVPASDNKPHKAKDDQDSWRSYVRVEDQTLVANKITVGVWRERKRKTSRPIAFQDDQLDLLKIIETHNGVSLSKLYRLSHMPYKEVDRLLIQFICWDVVVQDQSKDGSVFFLQR